MGRKGKKREQDDSPGAPEWMVTFSDCMTLLLTFFVLLLSFSSFDDRVFRNLRVLYASALTTISPMTRSDRDAFLFLPPVKELAELNKGNEKPTLDKEFKSGLLEETPPIDFHGGMVFSFSSKRVFLGKGMIFSPEGRQIMDMLALFLKGVPSRIVISENGPLDNNGGSEYYGMLRAWAALDYLSAKQNIDRGRFSISAKSTMIQDNSPASQGNKPEKETERTLEILLLDRSLYN